MIILGIDPGFIVSGFSILKKDGHAISLLNYGHLSMTSKQSIAERVEQFYNFYQEKISTYGVTHIAIETPFLGKNAAIFLKLGYLRGIVHLLANQNKLLILEFAPRQIKQHITGYGHATKTQLAHIVIKIFPKIKLPIKEDTSDAIAISLCAAWQTRLHKLQK